MVGRNAGSGCARARMTVFPAGFRLGIRLNCGVFTSTRGAPVARMWLDAVMRNRFAGWSESWVKSGQLLASNAGALSSFSLVTAIMQELVSEVDFINCHGTATSLPHLSFKETTAN